MSFLVTRQQTLENPFGPPRKVKELHEKRAAPMGYDYLGHIAGLLVSYLGRIVWPQGAGLFGSHAAGFARLPWGRIVWSQGARLFESHAAGFARLPFGRIACPKVQDYSGLMPQDLLSPMGQERLAPRCSHRPPRAQDIRGAEGQNRTRTRPRSGRASARSTGLHPSRGGGFLANERHHGVEPRPLVRPPKPQSGVHG